MSSRHYTSVTSISYDAFLNCNSLETITVDRENRVFDSRDNCNAIISTQNNELHIGCKCTIIPNTVTSIGEYAFYYCKGLTSITIPSSVSSIGRDAFWGCDSLTKVIVPDIAAWCSIIFDYSSNPLFYAKHLYADEDTEIKDLTIPEGVFTIGQYTFYCCEGLTSITVPANVTSINNNAFRGCSNLASITVAEDNAVYDSRDNCNAIIKTDTNELYLGCANTIIPNTLTSIGSDAFRDCISLTTINIPASVTSIGSGAFQGCTGLNKVIVPDIAAWCSIRFSGSSNPLYYAKHLYADEDTEIKDLTIPDGVLTIGQFTFYSCEGLTNITIPASVTSIGSNAFSDCTGLTTINIPASVTSIGNDAFYGCIGIEIITVDQGNKVYDSRDNCNAIVGTNNNELLFGCKNTIIPNSVTRIGYKAFMGCTGLTSINIPSSVTIMSPLEKVFNINLAFLFGNNYFKL